MPTIDSQKVQQTKRTQKMKTILKYAIGTVVGFVAYNWLSSKLSSK